MTEQWYSTKDLVELTGVSENTIKSWKRRNAFTEGTHFVSDGPRVMWLSAAIPYCKELHARNATRSDAPPATESVAGGATPTVADFAIEWGEQEIALADRIADLQIRREFGQLVESRIPLRLQAFRESVANDPSPYLDPLYLVGAGPRALGGAA